MRRSVPRVLCIFATALSLGICSLDSPRLARADVQPETDAVASRPHVKLDRLQLPAELSASDAKEFEKHLRGTLKREARRADWGADDKSRISYRFFVEQLELREEAGVLHVTCTALGRLPKGKSAKSHIAFGGDPRERKKVVEHVLDIVARGVVTRLAELERARRTP